MCPHLSVFSIDEAAARSTPFPFGVSITHAYTNLLLKLTTSLNGFNACTFDITTCLGVVFVVLVVVVFVVVVVVVASFDIILNESTAVFGLRVVIHNASLVVFVPSSLA